MLPRIASFLSALALALVPAAASAAPFFTEATARLGSPQPCGPGEDYTARD